MAKFREFQTLKNKKLKFSLRLTVISRRYLHRILSELQLAITVPQVQYTVVDQSLDNTFVFDVGHPAGREPVQKTAKQTFGEGVDSEDFLDEFDKKTDSDAEGQESSGMLFLLAALHAKFVLKIIFEFQYILQNG